MTERARRWVTGLFRRDPTYWCDYGHPHVYKDAADGCSKSQ